jgi:hypothetical protein
MKRLRFSAFAFFAGLAAFSAVLSGEILLLVAWGAYARGLDPWAAIDLSLHRCFTYIESPALCFALRVFCTAIGFLVPASILGLFQLRSINRRFDPNFGRCALVGAAGAPAFIAFLAGAVIALQKVAGSGVLPNFPISFWLLGLLTFGISGAFEGLAYRAVARVDTLGEIER